MRSILTEIVGYMAAFFGTILMLPQVYKSYKTKHVADISLIMLIVYLINCALWEIYGLMIHASPIILCNMIALMIGFLQLIIKVKYSRV